jgi:hypothetical protein
MKRCCVFALIFVLFALTSCGDDDPNRPDLPPAPLQATSPEEVADLLIISLEGKNIQRYDSLLAKDFVFYFDPRDAQNDSLDIPLFWGLEDEMQAVGNLFAAPDVEDIRLEWSPAPAVPSDSTGADTLLVVRNIFLEVEWRLTTQELLFLQVRGDFWLHMRQEPWTTPEGAPVWKVVIWEDKSLVLMTGQATQETTWGQIKALF